MISVLISRLVLLLFGTLYPAYASYKTVKTKNVRDYVKWMMYWIVFGGYTFMEIFADIFLAFWFPFYYELKIIFVLWLVCPSTRGSTYIFKKVVNPHLSKHEMVIDSYVAALWNHGYDLVRKIGAQGMDYLIEIVLELLRKGQISISHFMPKVSEVAQNVSTAQSMNLQKDSITDPNALDEDFIIMTDTSEVDETIYKSSELPLESSESEDTICTRSQSSKVKSKTKKVSSVRERKKAVKK